MAARAEAAAATFHHDVRKNFFTLIHLLSP
jgi:hypothetical protein